MTSNLFSCFDRDGSGLLDFREVFIGMSLLCSSTYDERIELVFEIMDDDSSGRISRHELEQFLIAVAPQLTTRADITELASQVMRGADDNNSGYITFREVSAIYEG